MKFVVIGDIHGLDTWKNIIKVEVDYDKVIFLGDYFDSFTIQPGAQFKNYEDIREFRDANPDKVITLLGNHDYHYMVDEKYSGWNSLTNLLSSHIITEDFDTKKLKYIYRYQTLIFSHAGITNYWLDEVAGASLEDLENNEVNLRSFKWNMFKGNNPYGDTISNSPIWVRPFSLKKDRLEGYTQVVGHTHSESESVTLHLEDDVVICDALPSQYLVININEEEETTEYIIKNTQ